MKVEFLKLLKSSLFDAILAGKEIQFAFVIVASVPSQFSEIKTSKVLPSAKEVDVSKDKYSSRVVSKFIPWVINQEIV